jgi:hypothetical protein
LKEIFSNFPFETFDVSTSSLSEFLSGTEELESMPKVSPEFVKNWTSNEFSSVIGSPIFKVGIIEVSRKISRSSLEPELIF